MTTNGIKYKRAPGRIASLPHTTTITSKYPNMTRTARSSSLKALVKDRSESRNNRDQSLRKGGAGQHNWGAMRDERDFEVDDDHSDIDEDDKDKDNVAGGEFWSLFPQRHTMFI